MPLTYAPNDTLISPVITQLTNIVTNQVGGITTIYATPPAGPPDDSSLVVLFSRGSNDKDPSHLVTIGRLRQKLTFVLMQFFRFNDISNAFITAYSYIPSYIKAFGAWSNQNLQSTAVEVTVTDYGVAQHPYAGQPYLVLGMTIEVVVEIPTPTI